jgi:heme/copper-type cytochrome/quinol oxidase subunit 3
MNTVILIVSGISITYSHLNILNSDPVVVIGPDGVKYEVKCSDGTICCFNVNSYPCWLRAIDGLWCTIILAIQFTLFQVYEYLIASFFISDGVYGSTFYMITGFHGFHVIVGTIFLIVCAVRMVNTHFLSYHHFGFEAAIWYWHFVDVVWLFVYLAIYCWGSGYS